MLILKAIPFILLVAIWQCDAIYMRKRKTGRFLSHYTLIRIAAALLGIAIVVLAAAFTGSFVGWRYMLTDCLYKLSALPLFAGVGFMLAYISRYFSHYKPSPVTGSHGADTKWYAYEVSADAPGIYSLHVSPASWYHGKRISNVSLIRSPHVVLQEVIDHIGHGQTLIIATPNERLLNAFKKGVPRLERNLPQFLTAQTYTKRMDFLTGRFANFLYGYGIPFHEPVVLKGCSFTT